MVQLYATHTSCITTLIGGLLQHRTKKTLTMLSALIHKQLAFMIMDIVSLCGCRFYSETLHAWNLREEGCL